MTKPRKEWTLQDLELFHDEHLDSDLVARLSEDLRCDAALRTRLAEIRRVDDAMRASLLQPRTVPTFHSVKPRRLLAVASLLLMVGVSGWFLTRGKTVGTPDSPGRFVESSSYSSVRVVYSIPLSAERKSAHVSRPSARPSAMGERVFLVNLRRPLIAGRVEEAMELLAAAPADQRRAGYRYLAEVLQSAQVAELILDRLGPDEQLIVCSQWASAPTMRPTVFARLQRLSEEPALASDLNSVLAELSIDPGLRAWLRGYQLF